MSGPELVQQVAGVVLDTGLKATVVLALPALLARPLARLSGAARHAVWSVALACVPLLAVAAAFGPSGPATEATWVMWVWAAGALVSGVPLLHGLLTLRRLTAEASGRGTVRTADVAGPLTWGVLRPVVLLPRAPGWTAGERAMVLAHERAHIARHDWLVHVLARAVCALLWFHPLAWLAWRRLAHAAEDAADDAVLRGGVRPSAYARLLVGATRTTPSVALAATRHPTHARVARVLAAHPRRGSRRGVVPLAALIGLGLIGTSATWTPLVLPPTCRAVPDAPDAPPPLLRRDP